MDDKRYQSVFIPQKGFEWHNEDAWGAGKKHPVFAVADGVTMPVEREADGDSPSKAAAELFCREAAAFAEDHFISLSLNILKDAYQYANDALARLNAKSGGGLKAAAALVAVKDGRIFGSRIADCGWALLRDGRLVWKTPEFWNDLKAKGGGGYGILGGRRDARRYVDTREIEAKAHDRLVLFTDGFEYHFGDKEFVSVLSRVDLSGLTQGIREIDEKLADADKERYGHERTLLLVQL